MRCHLLTFQSTYRHIKGVTCISIKIVFSVDDLRYFRKKCHGLHHGADLQLSYLWYIQFTIL